jgi:hypothetical protein
MSTALQEALLRKRAADSDIRKTAEGFLTLALNYDTCLIQMAMVNVKLQ